MLGVGVDIIEISRMAETLARSGDVFLNRVFTEREQLMGKSHHAPATYYATRFAAKEAVFKSLGIGWDGGVDGGVDLRDIEVLRGPRGEPLVELGGRLALLASERGKTRVLLSLSYDDDSAIAFVALVQATESGRGLS